MKIALPASILGMYVCLLLWAAGFKYTDPTIASVLSQTSVIFALVLATVILKELFDRRTLAAVLLSVAGVAVVTLGARHTGLPRPAVLSPPACLVPRTSATSAAE